MSKGRKRKDRERKENARYFIWLLDRLNWDDDCKIAGPLSYEDANEKFDELTKNGTENTRKHTTLSYYEIRPE